MKDLFLIAKEQNGELRKALRQPGRYLRSVINGETIIFEEGRVTCLQVSEHDLLLEIPQRFKLGDIFEVTFPASGNRAIVLEVRWSDSPSGRTVQQSYRVGCRRLFSAEEWEAID